MDPDSVQMKLRFARRRLNDFEDLRISLSLPSNPEARHQLSQEFFFHLVGAVEYVAQLVNEIRSLGIAVERVAVHRVCAKLDASDPLLALLQTLSVDTKQPFPQDPDSDARLIYRLINYRNEVVHRNINPFNFVLSAGPKEAFLLLDPRDRTLGVSAVPAHVELERMYSIVEGKCRDALSLLGA